MSTYLVAARVQVSIDADSENEAANLVHDMIHGHDPAGVHRCIEEVSVLWVNTFADEAPEWTL